MVNHTDPVRALISKWRGSWADGYMTGVPRIDEITDARAAAKEECADELESALASAPPSAPVGVERKYPDDGNGDDDAYNRGWNACLDALAQQPAAVDGDTVRSVAQHIANAADHIDMGYPDAKTLDAGVILRIMRRWHAQLTAALAAQQQGGAE